MDFIISKTWIITLGEGAQNRPWVCMYVCKYVCMSFIFRKSFTRYGNSHITNNKKHSNIEYHIYLVERKFVGNKKYNKNLIHLRYKKQI